MLETVFLKVFNMSFTAGFVILIVLAARVLIKKLPKIYSYLLWSVVLIRLLIPVSVQSMFSLLPVNPMPVTKELLFSEEPQIHTGLDPMDRIVNSILISPDPRTNSVNPVQVWIAVGSVIWMLGIIAFGIYIIISLFQLRRRLIGAVRLRDNIYLVDHIQTPFVFHVLRPKIYLPSGLEEQEQEYILLHEQTHIRRKDPLMKALAFTALCIHWFHPLVWIAFFLAERDMEMSCDESVIKRKGIEIRADYSASLLRLAAGKRLSIHSPLGFGEGDTKRRIKNIMSYKKPVMMTASIAIIAVVVLCISCGLDRKDSTAELQKTPVEERNKNQPKEEQGEITPIPAGTDKIEMLPFEGYQMEDGATVPVTFSIGVSGVRQGEEAWNLLQQGSRQIPEPEEGMEYIIFEIRISYDAGETNQLILTENHASLPEANLYFSLTDGIKNAEQITELLEDPIYEHSVPLGETIEGNVAFLHTTGSKDPLVFAGFGTIVEFRFQEE